MDHVVDDRLDALLVVAAFKESFFLLVILPFLLQLFNSILTFNSLFFFSHDGLSSFLAGFLQGFCDFRSLSFERVTVFNSIVYFLFIHLRKCKIL